MSGVDVSIALPEDETPGELIKGYFTLMLYPPSAPKQRWRTPMEMVFVIDTSGSMNGKPLAQAKRAVNQTLDVQGYFAALQSVFDIHHTGHGNAISVGGYLQLSPEAEVRVGKLTYSLASAAERLGMSPVELRLELNRSLRRLGFVDPEA